VKRLLPLLLLPLGAAAYTGGSELREPEPAAVLHAPDDGPIITVDSPLWRRQSDSDGIVLYEADVQRGGVVPVKAEMTIPGTIEEISAVLEDIPRRGDWVMHFGESRLLERRNDYQQSEYLRMAMPWPVADRCTLVQVDISVSDDRRTASIAAHSIDCCLPAGAPDNVRAKVYASTFQMTQDGPQVRVVGLVFIDPEGALPKWAVNLYTRVVARHTLSHLRRQVGRKLYGPAVLADLTRRIQGYQAWAEKNRAPAPPRPGPAQPRPPGGPGGPGAPPRPKE
jgi:hypothetical protein